MTQYKSANNTTVWVCKSRYPAPAQFVSWRPESCIPNRRHVYDLTAHIRASPKYKPTGPYFASAHLQPFQFYPGRDYLPLNVGTPF
ncbi:hypothetical protein AAVH_00049 [Aphelenchoides avenae]|nr:hypothetical protein AAVH_00049 [Aphelenchus avenae]